MRYELLGNLRVVDRDRGSFVSAQKVEILLGALLIRANYVLTPDQLMAEIWGDRLPRRATAGLHVYVSELRKFLSRPDRPDGPIVTRSPGYLLDLGADTLDYQVFLDLADIARGHLKEGRFEEASLHCERALALWRGPVLGDIGTGPILRSFTTRLTEARLDCTEMLMEAQLHLDRHREVVGILYSLVTENPLREAFYRQLMLALYRAERRADALNVYRSARQTLIDELGLEPCPGLQELHRAILRADEPVLGAYATV